MSEEKKYGIWEYMSEQHGLTLLGSEVQEILNLARQEIELPDEEEIEEAEWEYIRDSPDYNSGQFTVGVKWALNKVRNPYPKQINP